MSKFIRMKSPPSIDPENKNPLGRYYIQPINMFKAKGFFWGESIRWEYAATAFDSSKGIVLISQWGKPKLEQERGDYVRIGLLGCICRCKECREGRREVKKGWTPWGKKK